MVFILVLVTAGCGGGGGGGGSASNPVAGIDRAGVTTGTVTGFGSVFVNGVEFETNSASFDIDDGSGSESDLSVGSVVTVTGTVNADGKTGTATRISYEAELEGPIGSIDTVNGSFVVLGTTVLTDVDTSWDSSIVPASVLGLTTSDFVEVSGFHDASGNLRATRVQVVAARSEVEVTGYIMGLDTTAGTFMINNLVVDYLSFPASLDNSFPGGSLSEGDFVEAKGTSFGPAGELIATRIDRESDGDAGESGDDSKLEGYITRFDSPLSFDVSGVSVTTTDNTVYKRGSVADLGPDIKVEVEGSVNSDGIVVATKIEFGHGSDAVVKVSGPVQDVSTSAGTLVILGITIHVDDKTRIEDKIGDSNVRVRRFSLSDINPGDFIEVHASEINDSNGAPTGEVQAVRLERDDSTGRVEIQGPVTSVTEPSFVILGVTVDTDAGTSLPVGFFGTVMPGSIVKAKGTGSSTTAILATEVEFED